MASTRTSWFWLVPAATFLVGLLLGGLLVAVGVTGDSDGDGEAAPAETDGGPATSAPTTPAPTGTPRDLTVTVPAACLEMADAADRILALGREAASTITTFDARELQRVVDEMQQLDSQVRELTARCRAAGASR